MKAEGTAAQRPADASKPAQDKSKGIAIKSRGVDNIFRNFGIVPRKSRARLGLLETDQDDGESNERQVGRFHSSNSRRRQTAGYRVRLLPAPGELE
jgi:hypothetical protein